MIIKEYLKCKSCIKVSEKYNLSSRTILNILQKNEISRQEYGRHRKKYLVNESIFDTINTEEKAYWLGFLYADGCVTNNNRLQLTLNPKDYEHLVKFSSFLESTHPIKSHNRFDKKYKKYYFASRLFINCKKICESLKNKGCVPRKTHKLTFPNCEQVPNYLIHHFLRGYFDGDGGLTIYKNRIIFSVVGVYNFIYEYSKLLRSNTNLNENKILKCNTIYSINYSGNYNLTQIYNFLYKDAKVWLDRKKYIWDTVKPTYYRSQKHEYSEKILEMVKLNNGILSAKDIARFLNFKYENIRYIIKSLTKEKKIYWEKINNKVIYYYNL